MKNNKILYILGALLLLSIAFNIYQYKKDTDQMPIHIIMQVPVPKLIGNFEKIAPKPLPPINNIIEVNNALVEEYEKVNDSLKKELFKKAVTINRYEEKFEDSVQIITVNAKTTGTLDSLGVKYETKPFTIPLDTTIYVDVPYKTKFGAGLEVGVPALIPNKNFILKGNVAIDTKNKIFNLGLDTEGRAWGGLIYKF